MSERDRSYGGGLLHDLIHSSVIPGFMAELRAFDDAVGAEGAASGSIVSFR